MEGRGEEGEGAVIVSVPNYLWRKAWKGANVGVGSDRRG